MPHPIAQLPFNFLKTKDTGDPLDHRAPKRLRRYPEVSITYGNAENLATQEKGEGKRTDPV